MSCAEVQVSTRREVRTHILSGGDMSRRQVAHVRVACVALRLSRRPRRRFGPGPAAILGVTFLLYVTWTVLMTQVATDVRKVRK